GLIPPPSLQIVMDRLYRQALAQAGLKPPAEGAAGKDWTPPELALTFDLYRELGGAGDILADYVKDALDDAPERGGDRAVAEALLKVLVTSQATKAALNDAEMVAGMAEADPDFDPDNSRDVNRLHATRQALVDLRLLRSFTAASQAREGALYELAHDYIAAEIATWIDEGEMQTKLVRELLRRELESYRILDKLIEPAALKMIHEQREGLRRLTPDELELLFRSALAAGHEVAYWFERAREGDVPVDDIARDGLKSNNFDTRAAAVVALGELGERFAGPLAEMLKDDYPQVRVTAIHALERLQPDGTWRERLVYECYVPAGPFIMGDDNSSQSNEKPAHEVTLDAYYIAKYPVTNAEYKRYRNDVGQPFDVPDGKSDHPVVSVSWYDARDYAAWAGMRMLTEAQWEKAASWEERDRGRLQQVVGRLVGKDEEKSGGKKREYPWGNGFDKDKCNTRESDIGTTTPVGKYSPAGDSPYGCVDMAGNVWEWTSSLKKSYPYQADDGREDMGSTGSRVLRGGSFEDGDDYARSTYRHHDTQNDRFDDYGFRVVVAPFSLKPLASEPSEL
ncbi:MAG: SUMF1/EgtB/PvdO family nonheme iron enzyme, partial [Chloroflexi bacterium]|nr:SUMF1/EgtB/PvdO family nonheme iron enzyme [Chloroflexota bacterium]